MCNYVTPHTSSVHTYTTYRVNPGTSYRYRDIRNVVLSLIRCSGSDHRYKYYTTKVTVASLARFQLQSDMSISKSLKGTMHC